MVQKPWGFYEVLSVSPICQVKRIVVFPEQRLSYQRHFRRAEHWFIVQGEATIIRNDVPFKLIAGDAINIPVEAWHRVENQLNVNLEFIEIQTGDYFGEDEIERIKDDYGRIIKI
jgi:mannose-6-phosphate isomerase-like protein (cupin superfamily)